MSVPASVERRAMAAAARVAVCVADAARARVPGVRVVLTDAEVVVTGRGMLADPVLRWPAGMLR